MTKARSNATAEAAKGDLRVGNGTNLSGILAVGSNGDTLVADSSTSTGLRYTAGTVQDNPVLNSAFQVWQRGTSISVAASTNTYTSDRWMLSPTTSDYTVARQNTSDTTNLPFIQYCNRVQRNAGQTGTTANYFAQSLETINSIPYSGKTVTLSFYARSGANFSGGSNLLGAFLVSGTGTDQNIITAYTGSATVATSNVTLTTTWQRFTISGTVATSATELAMYFSYTPVGTAGANDYYEVTGVQIDVGSVALPFRTNGGTIQGELAACQRYARNIAGTTGLFSPMATGFCFDTTNAFIFVPLPGDMRTTPTLSSVTSAAANFQLERAGTLNNLTGLSLSGSATASNRGVYLTAVVASGLTGGQFVVLRNNNSATNIVLLDAEL
jgi:hypothetical protein